MILKAAFSSSFVLLSLGDDGVNGDGGLTGRTVTNDELTLTTTDGDHGVNGHDACLHWHRNGLSLNDAGSDLFNWILVGGFDLTFAVEWTTEVVDDAAKHVLTNRNGK